MELSNVGWTMMSSALGVPDKATQSEAEITRTDAVNLSVVFGLALVVRELNTSAW